jgi:hypothetical protein
MSHRNNESPAVRLRDIVDETGEFECRVEALLELHGFGSLTSQARGALERSLEQAGLTAVPALAGAQADDAVVISSVSERGRLERRIAELEQALRGARTQTHVERERRAEAEQALEAERHARAAHDGQLEEAERIVAAAHAEAEQMAASVRQDAKAILVADREEADRAIAAARNAVGEERGLREQAERQIEQMQEEVRTARREAAEAKADRDRERAARKDAEKRLATQPREAVAGPPAVEAAEETPTWQAQVQRQSNGTKRALFRDPPTAPAPTEGSGGRVRRAFRRRPFIERPGSCGVCQTVYHAENAAELASSGWAIQGEVGLCPSCLSKGWTLPEGGSVPQRRYSDRHKG